MKASGALGLLLALSAPVSAAVGGELGAEESLKLKRLVEQGRELAAPGRAARRHALLTVRLPTWELAAVREGGAFASPGIALSSVDVAKAREVFGDALDTDAVRIVYTEVAWVSAPMTWGNTIRVPVWKGMGYADLIHELAHVWQYQTGGAAYISDSLLHNTAAFITTGKRSKAYRYKIVEGKSFFDYTAEKQAKILEDFYKSRTKREDPRYQRLVAEMRTRKAPRGKAVLPVGDLEAGLPPRHWAVPPPPGLEPDRVMPGVPQLELRFDTPW